MDGIVTNGGIERGLEEIIQNLKIFRRNNKFSDDNGRSKCAKELKYLLIYLI
jgi:hypothetical protein